MEKKSEKIILAEIEIFGQPVTLKISMFRTYLIGRGIR